MPHIQPTTSPKGGNTGSCTAAITYLEKEDKGKELFDREFFFNQHHDLIIPEFAEQIIDHSKLGLRKEDAKFFAMTYSFSEEELEGRTDKQLKEFVKKHFAKDYVAAVKGRDINPDTIMFVAKLEQDRFYKGTDKEVIEGKYKQGQAKEGDNRHIHVLVARNTTENKKISPLTNHRGESAGPVKSGFDRVGFKEQTEKSFDEHFNYNRPLEHKFEYLNSDNRAEKLQELQQRKVKEIPTAPPPPEQQPQELKTGRTIDDGIKINTSTQAGAGSGVNSDIDDIERKSKGRSM